MNAAERAAIRASQAAQYMRTAVAGNAAGTDLARDQALDVATRTLAAIVAGEPATDGDYRAAAAYPDLPPGQLDDGQIAAAAALERMRRIGAQPPTSPQPTDTTATGDS